MAPSGDEQMSVAEAARQAGMSIEGIRDAIRRGRLKAEVVETRPVYAIRLSELRTYLEEVDKEPRGRPRSLKKKKKKGS
jgi:hypothetical protein